jgi:hypothetical protein
MPWGIFIVLFGLWSLGLVEGVGGPLIHALLVTAAMALIYNLLGRRRKAS